MVLYLMFFHPRGALISLSISILLLPTTADTLSLQVIKADCAGDSYAQNSSFAGNLAAVLSFLASKSSSSNSATANVTIAGNSSDAAYGLYMCQGDLDSSDCHACVSTAATAITQNCPSAQEAIIWYDYCQLRYSNLNFFGTPDTGGYSLINKNEKTSSIEPLTILTDLVKSAPLQKPLMYASKALVTESLYGLAQCTVDLSTDGCSKCLTTILDEIKSCCTEWDGWRYLATSCMVRYEATPFLRNLNGTYTEITRRRCSASSFPSNSTTTMESNLNTLLLNLTSEAKTTGFYNSTAGESPDNLYGLALCRGDLTSASSECNTCLGNAERTIAGDCPNSTEGIKWYEKCLVRYSNQNFFGVVDLAGQTLCGVEQVGQAVSDATIKWATVLVSRAVNNPLMVAAGREAIDNLLLSYVLVQCTRDLSGEGCKKCLDKGLGEVNTQCKQTNGWRYLSGSCTLRYEVFPFFHASTMSSPGPQPSAPPHEEGAGGKELSHAKIAAIVASVLGATLLVPLLYYLWLRLRRKKDGGKVQLTDLSPLPDTDLPLMDLAIIQEATGNFSSRNKLGEGGFGPVYKGIIYGGTEIAVKKLSKKSKQGAVEYKNEVKLIAKLQHRNLVKMLGCCIEGEEKLLIYEFMPNKSLDVFLFDPNKRAQLDWNRRLQIISGIARGLLYLHEDSRLKVIHRDLKASNVLLDNEMNPKISDFGMAKIFEADESETNEANTRRIVGTYGYMAPEYAMNGVFSVKSDVYSFGVLILEIISGQKNGRSHFERYGQTLLRQAWQLWNEGNALKLMDSLLEGSYPTKNGAIKCIHIGLLCVQENSEERPTMSLVVHMLRGDETVLPPPTQPPTFISQKTSASDFSSTNEVTQSIVLPR